MMFFIIVSITRTGFDFIFIISSLWLTFFVENANLNWYLHLFLVGSTNSTLFFAFFKCWEIVRVQTTTSMDERLAIAGGDVEKVTKSRLGIGTIVSARLSWQIATGIGGFGGEEPWRSWGAFLVTFFHCFVTVASSSTIVVDSTQTLVRGWIPVPVADFIAFTPGFSFNS